MTAPAAPAVPAPTEPPTAPTAPAAPVPAPPANPAPLHDDPAVAKALEGLTEAQRETLLTTGGKNALAARAQEVRDAKAAAATAAETAKNELAQTIGKALGLVEDEATDPAKLTEALTVSNAAAKHAQIELAVFHAAGPVGVDAAALLDSRKFMAKIAGIDPADGVAVAAAIGEAVTANPTLAKTRLPAHNPALGSSAAGAPDLEAQIAQAKKDGNFKLVIQLENQKIRTA